VIIATPKKEYISEKTSFQIIVLQSTSQMTRLQGSMLATASFTIVLATNNNPFNAVLLIMAGNLRRNRMSDKL
jgi:hypothetical protein